MRNAKKKKLSAKQARGVQDVLGCNLLPGGEFVELHTAKGRDFVVPIASVVDDWANRLRWHPVVDESEQHEAFMAAGGYQGKDGC